MRRRATVLLAVVLGSAGVTGCGDDAPAATEPAATEPAAATPVALAASLECADFATVATDEAQIAEAGTCMLDTELLRLVTFADDAALQVYLDEAAARGGVVVHGSDWAVLTASAPVAERVQEQLGGEIAAT